MSSACSCRILALAQNAEFGMILQAGLVPDAYIGMGNAGVGCFKPAAGITNGKCICLLRERSNFLQKGSICTSDMSAFVEGCQCKTCGCVQNMLHNCLT